MTMILERHPDLAKMSDREVVYCNTCRLSHASKPGSSDTVNFFLQHPGHDVRIAYPDRLKLDELFDQRQDLWEEYRENANVKFAFGAATAFTKTNANIATSATAGWKSNAVDETTNLMLDALVQAEFALVNTAPANSKCIFLYASSFDGTSYTNTGAAAIDGNEGTVTFPDITTLSPTCGLLGAVSYPVQNIALVSPGFSVARCFGGILPIKWCISMVNHSGMTLSVTNIWYTEVFQTVI